MPSRNEDEAGYFARRAEEERGRAAIATTASARLIHLELAQLYDARGALRPAPVAALAR